MGKPTMAIPAFSIAHRDPGNNFSMTALAIGFNHFDSAFGQSYVIRDPSGKENERVPHSLIAFLKEVVDYLIVREMTVDAFDSTVGPLMPPGFILGFHYMAGGAEFGGFGFGVELGGTEGSDQTPGDRDDYPNRQKGPKPFSLKKSHGLLPLLIGDKSCG